MESSLSLENARRGPAIDLGKAALAGALGGVAGTAIKTVCELISPPRPPGVASPLGNMLTAAFLRLTGHGIPPNLQPFAEPATHWVFGIGTGLLYGLIAERFPRARAGYGIAFGVAFWFVLHEVGLPLAGFSPSPAKMTLWEQGNELVSHMFYGVGVELVRRTVRRRRT